MSRNDTEDFAQRLYAREVGQSNRLDVWNTVIWRHRLKSAAFPTS